MNGDHVWSIEDIVNLLEAKWAR